MTPVLNTCLRYLLILIFGLDGLAFAQSAPTAARAHAAAMRGAAVMVAPDTAMQPDHCRVPVADRHSPSGTSAPAHGATDHGCCKGGICACTCAASAFIATCFLATPVPLLHERAVTLQEYRPSHLLPLPFRPPIA